jgi:phosphate transport system substrate-binding protein
MLKKLVVAAAAATLLAGAGIAQATDITGAGATFPKDIYGKWADAYKSKTGAVVNYQAIGSGGGIKAIKAKTVDFGASDKPLPATGPADKDSLASTGLYQFPTVVGGIVPIFNVPGIASGQLKLTGPVIADIYLGNISNWDDRHIAALNPGVKLPHHSIKVVHRADGSGTTFIFTHYLSDVSPTWAKEVGFNDAVNWKLGDGGKGNDGVSALVKQTQYAIGYVEYFYAKQNKLTYALVQNKAGAFPLPVAASFAAAAKGADWSKAPGNYLLLLNQPGAQAWPITGATFILVYKKQSNPVAGKAVLEFFDWAYKNGDQAANELDFVPLPTTVKNMVRKQWATEVLGPDGKPVYVSH